jgi:hypothetical protein
MVVWLGPVDNVATVEVNTFGDQPRTAIIYRDADNSIELAERGTLPEHRRRKLSR